MSCYRWSSVKSSISPSMFSLEWWFPREHWISSVCGFRYLYNYHCCSSWWVYMINDVRVRHERRRPTVYGDDLGQWFLSFLLSLALLDSSSLSWQLESSAKSDTSSRNINREAAQRAPLKKWKNNSLKFCAKNYIHSMRIAKIFTSEMAIFAHFFEILRQKLHSVYENC